MSSHLPRALLALSLVVAAAPAQATKAVTNEKHGFKLRVPRFTKEVPTKPDEEQIIAKFKGTKRVKAARHKDRKGRWVKHVDTPFEVWVVRIVDPKDPTGNSPVTQSGPEKKEPAVAPKDLAEQIRIRKNSGRTIKEFLDLRFRKVSSKMDAGYPGQPIKNKDRETYAILKSRGNRPGQLQTYTVTHEHADHGHELFGLVFLVAHPEVFAKDILTVAKSLQRLAKKTNVYAKEDPYEGSDLSDIERRREVRSRLVEGWYAEDTENFILVTDMTNNSANRKLLRDLLVDLEIMREAYKERFPPAIPVKAVCTVRVCNSYAGYVRYSSKPGTGGYWHPIAEELVLFNPVGKIKKAAWMRRTSPKAIMYHEAMHQYFHYSTGGLPPAIWLNEGYAEYFGGAKTDRYAMNIRTVGKNDMRWQVIKKAKKTNKWPELKKLLSMTKAQFYSRKSKDYPVLNNYAFGWAFCYFLELERAKRPEERNQEWAQIPDRYMTALRAATDEQREKLPEDSLKGALLRYEVPVHKVAFERTFKSMDFKKLQSAWVAAMKSWK